MPTGGDYIMCFFLNFQQCLAYGNASVTTGNVGWFGEDVTLPEKQEGGDKKFEYLR